jgi:hypothetical protein
MTSRTSGARHGHGHELDPGRGSEDEPFPAAMWHVVERPRRVWVEDAAGEPETITIESQDGTLTVVGLAQQGG